jgi:hypothetical protein
MVAVMEELGFLEELWDQVLEVLVAADFLVLALVQVQVLEIVKV